MEKTIEKKGKSIDEAIEKVLEELNASREDVEIEIIQAPAKGLFGIGNKEAVVKGTIKSGPKQKAQKFLSDVFEKMGLDVAMELEEAGEDLNIDLSGKEMGILIGRRGETLDALQYLTRLVVNKGEESYSRVSIDTENYRKKREETLKRLANKLADKVMRTRRSVSLEPMNPFERKIIHAALQDNKCLNTYSIGEEPNRKIVISYKRNAE